MIRFALNHSSYVSEIVRGGLGGAARGYRRPRRGRIEPRDVFLRIRTTLAITATG